MKKDLFIVLLTAIAASPAFADERKGKVVAVEIEPKIDAYIYVDTDLPNPDGFDYDTTIYADFVDVRRARVIVRHARAGASVVIDDADKGKEIDTDGTIWYYMDVIKSITAPNGKVIIVPPPHTGYSFR